MEHPKQPDPFILLTDEILLHVLSFFVEDRRKTPQGSNRHEPATNGPSILQQRSVAIDEKALKSVMLMSKRWKRLAYSKELWKIPCGVDKDEVAFGNSVLLVDRTFRELSFVGFVKLYPLANEADRFCSYRVRERATDAEFDMFIETIASNENENTTSLVLSRNQLKEFFTGHFVYAENFMNECMQLRQLHVPFRVHTAVHLLRQDGNSLLPVCRFVKIYWANCLIRPILSSEAGHLDFLARYASQALSTASGLEANTWNWRIKHLLRLEKSVEPFDPNRRHMQPDHWAQIVDWVVEIVQVFNLQDDLIVHRCMAYVDQLIARISSYNRPRFYQRISAGCLFVAATLSESNQISPGDLVMSGDTTFSSNELLRYGEIMVEHCDYKLARPTILDYVNLYAPVVCNNLRAEWTMKYLAELALETSIYVTYRPSLIAACVVVLALYMVGQEADMWPDSLVVATGYEWENLEACTLDLSRMMEENMNAASTQSIIRHRYRAVNRGQVANQPVPRISTFFILTSHRQRMRARQAPSV